MQELSSYLGLKNIKKIEGYDVSHFSGDNAVASCVVFSSQGPEKKNYRLFNIPAELSGNDTGSLEHVIKRRIKSKTSKLLTFFLLSHLIKLFFEF